MFPRRSYAIPLKEHQTLYVVYLGDIHADTDEFHQPRFERFVQWCVNKQKAGDLVRCIGLGDYNDFKSPSERMRQAGDHETTKRTYDKTVALNLQELLRLMAPLRGTFIGLHTGHHMHRFESAKTFGPMWVGRSSDEWLSRQLGCDYFGDGVAYVRLQFAHGLYLDSLTHHGGGSAQTPGGRVMKRVRLAEVAPEAHFVVSGHDNARFGYPRSGLHYERGEIKRYVMGSGSFQRAYLEGSTSFAESLGLIPADLGPAIAVVTMEKYKGEWELDYRALV